MDFKEHIIKQTYDRWYQDIEYLNHVGYAESWRTWANIKDLVDWKDKVVVDIGCFHGYFCFKAEQMGARAITGVDKNLEVLTTTRMLGGLLDSKCAFVEGEASSGIPSSDILLCLNMFHHIQYKESFLEKICANKIIFEIDKENLRGIQDYCNILVQKPSHRPSAHTGDVPNRLVLLAERK